MRSRAGRMKGAQYIQIEKIAIITALIIFGIRKN